MGRGQDLLDAARKGDERSVEKILIQITKRSGPFTSLSLRRGAGVNVQDDNGYTPLHHACLQGHKEIVSLLLNVDANPCVVDKMGATALHLASWKGDAEIVAMLLAHNNPKVDVNQLTLDQETALIMASQYGFVSVVAQLIARGADVSIRNIKGDSALDLAAQYGRLSTVKHLIQVEPALIHPYKYPNWRNHKFCTTPLHRASKNGHKDVVQVLLKAGIDPNIRTNSGTPLHEAACFGKAAVVEVLLRAGADLKATDSRDKTVEDLLADYSEEVTRQVRWAIQVHKNKGRNNYESEDEVPPFPVDYSPTSYHAPVVKHPELQKLNNLSDSLITPSPSFLTKNPPQSFVKKLASKCLGLKAKFNSAPNISNPGLESNVDGKLKHSDSKNSATALHIGNSKFFKILSKKEESGDIDCTDEFDTISLDRLGTLNRDSTVNRSNRSCPGFKTSLPNISENNELDDSHESLTDNLVNSKADCDYNKNKVQLTEAINYDSKYTVFEPRTNSFRKSTTSNMSLESAVLVNECYESYEFTGKSSSESVTKVENKIIPKPPPRTALISSEDKDNAIYENIQTIKTIKRPTPAARTHITPQSELEKRSLYENVSLKPERKAPEPPKRSFFPTNVTSVTTSTLSRSESVSSSSSTSTDSMTDESNLEDILLSEKSKSFRHERKILVRRESSKASINRTQSNASDFSDVTEASAIENVDCSDEKLIYLSMTGTLPNKRREKPKKKVLFRHKTFTNIEVDRNSIVSQNLTKRNPSFLKETLPNYHIRGTGHCIYKAPTVEEFIYIFNRDTLYKDVEPFTKVPNDKRESYFETAICFCKPQPKKHHNSAEDLLDIPNTENEEKVSIDIESLRNTADYVSSSFRCFCDSGNCSLHASRGDRLKKEFIVKFSAIKRSISTPDITLDISPSSTVPKRLVKNKSVPSNLEDPYAVVNIRDVIKDKNDIDCPAYVPMSGYSSMSSTDRPYSVKDISDVISLGTNSSSTDPNNSFTDAPSIRKSSSSENSGHWSLHTCNSNVTVVSDASFKTCFEESEESDGTLHSDEDSSDAETVKSDVSTTKRPWVDSGSFKFNRRSEDVIKDSNSSKFEIIEEGSKSSKFEIIEDTKCSKFEMSGSESSSDCETDACVLASLERIGVGGVRSGRRRWEEGSENDALSVSSATSSCAPHLMHHEYSKVSPTPPKKPPRRNLSVSPTHVNSPSSGYSYELRAHARSQDDLDEIQGSKHYLKHGRSVDQYVDSKLSYSEYEANNSPRAIPVPNPRTSLKNRTQPVAITAMYENVVIKEQNPRRKLRRNTFGPQYENCELRMTDKRVRKYSNQERSSLESLLDDQSMVSPSDCDRYSDSVRRDLPMSPTHYQQPPTPDHPPPSAKQAENSIHERIRPLSQLIMEVVEEIRIRKKSQGDVANS